ncbi:hypothetical protein DPMN_169587 [Dreissena polymorpha]|uniref:NACHT domain-containing protein n=1 Tax=Dreissena polymorpha TaxID=45954 RepID=A0A9D4DXN5_DREPO|nr:hypothetical protein DPMN_169587 [Dreissena polymorpha]
MIEGMKKLYNHKLSHVTISPLNDYTDEYLRDVYMPPKLLAMYKDRREFKKGYTLVTQYKDVFSTDEKVYTRIFLQGEAGSGKTTFLAKLVLDWCEESHISSTSDKSSHFFADVHVLKGYVFVFHILLRNAVKQFDVYTMIKEQIIDLIYSQEDREKAYRLLNEIMKRERCLALLDGLDEWTGPGDPHNLPTLVVDHSKCVMIITTRPWKLAVGKITHSDINALLQLEGINKPLDLSKVILSRFVDIKELEIKHSAFKDYILNQKLEELLSSPLMLSAIVCSYAEGIELKGSKCEIYILLLESLFKKPNSEICTFEQPPYPCFKRTQYIQTNIEQLNRLSELAFHLMFVNEKENSIAFSIMELKKFKLNESEHKEFVLKSGILTETRNASILRSESSFMFFHLSMQEFLAAYHIARNTHLIDGIISDYLKRHNAAYLDVSQVFIFLCGLDISGAEKLSSMMNEQNTCDAPGTLLERDGLIHLRHLYDFQKIPLAGYREAVSNGHTGISITLSHFNFDLKKFDEHTIRDLHRIWTINGANAISLVVYCENTFEKKRISTANDESASHIKFDLNSCTQLKYLQLGKDGILITGKYTTMYIF